MADALQKKLSTTQLIGLVSTLFDLCETAQPIPVLLWRENTNDRLQQA